MLKLFTLVGGQRIYGHTIGVCAGDPCPLHNPSDHHMLRWKQNWRWLPPFDLRGIMERVCEHGIGHPDPDDYKIRNGFDAGFHGCDGCCRPGGGSIYD